MNAQQLIQRETGLNLSPLVAERAVAERLARLGRSDAQAYLQSIAPEELKALTELVVVPESWMFRDAEAFHTLANLVRQRLATAPGRIVRILSVPCAGGEEPYSIAMVLMDAGVPRTSILIDAIDLSEVALERARAGRYTRNAFRGGELAFRERHFTQEGNEYQINHALREQVNFSQGNLLALDAIGNAGRYDVVFCRNLLIYFDDSTTATAIAKLRLLLADEGVLFAGYAEVPAYCRNGFAPLRIPGAFALQKERRAEARPAVVPPPPPPPPAPLRSTPAAPVRNVAPAPLAASSAPPDPAALTERAARLADQGDLDGAAQLCHAVLKTRPDSADAYFILGIINECANKPGVADDYWRRCVYLQPDHYEALCHLALLAEQRGEAGKASNFRQRAARVYNRRGDSANRKPS
jgi:chemotaxis protein methyltransferase WspC